MFVTNAVLEDNLDHCKFHLITSTTSETTALFKTSLANQRNKVLINLNKKLKYKNGEPECKTIQFNHVTKIKFKNKI